MSKIVLMMGFPGSGKSTLVAEALSRHEEIVVLSRDDIRQMLNGGKYKFIPQREPLVNQIIVNALEDCIDKGYDVVLDECCVNQKFRHRWLNTVKSIGDKKDVPIKTMGIWMDTPVHACKARRNMFTKGSNEPWDVIIENMAKSWEDPNPNDFDEFVRKEYDNVLWNREES
jgi:predicted kinase|tara:strand:+ start:10660 stop:11172 length:513 start_codon:yes stop_codon:yes gene_type:complete